jgi:hypothetical protein
LRTSNTHESMHWLVAALGAFRIDADLDLADVHSALWLTPPPNWGSLSLTLDEVAGFSALCTTEQSFIDFARLLRDKKGLLKAGLLTEWTASVNKGIEQRKKYEEREVEVKARELISWVEKIKAGPIKLPPWVANELETTFGFGPDGDVVLMDKAQPSKDSMISSETKSSSATRSPTKSIISVESSGNKSDISASTESNYCIIV